MIKALIIDDEPLAASIVQEYLAGYHEVQVLQVCNDGFEGLKAIQQLSPDIVFLDIQMPKINGFEMLELIEEPPAVIFTTAFDEYALKAFDAHAIDYLLKPFGKDRFDRAMGRFLDQKAVELQKQNVRNLVEAPAEIPTQAERIVIKTAGKIKIIPVPSVHYFEAADDYVKIYTSAGQFLKNRTMANFEKILPPEQFVRIHRSYIVNVQQITRIEPYEKESHVALLQSGAKVPISQTGYSKLKQVLGL